MPLLAVVAVVAALATPGPARRTVTDQAEAAAPKALDGRTVAALTGLPSGCTDAGNNQVTCSWGGNVSTSVALSPGASTVSYTLAGGAGNGADNSGDGGRGAVLTGTLYGVGGTTLHIGTGQKGGGDPDGTYGDFGGGGAGSGAGGGHYGDNGGGASVLGSNSSLLVVAGGGGGGGGNYGGGGGRGGDADTGGGNTNNTHGGGGSSRSSGSFQYGGGGGGGGGGYWGGNGGGACNGCSGGGGQGGDNAGLNGASYSYTDLNGGDGYANLSWYRSAPSISPAMPGGTVYAWSQNGLSLPVSVGTGATGTLTVTDGLTGATVCSTSLIGGAATCTLTPAQLSGGSHPLTFSYSGDAGYQARSVQRTLAVTADPATSAVTADRQQDGTYTISATVTPSSAAYLVDGNLSLSASPAIPGLGTSCPAQTAPAPAEARRNVALSLTCTVAVPPGDYTITGAFASASGNTTAPQATKSVSIAKYTPAVALTLDPAALDAYGRSTTATVTVQAPAGALVDPTGAVTVSPTSGAGSSCTAASADSVSNHTATYTCAVTPRGGASTYVAHYAGSSAYLAGDSDATDVQVTAAPPTVTIDASSATLTAGQSLTLTASATTAVGNANIAAGTLTFYDGPVGPGGLVVGTVDLGAHPGGGAVTFTPVAGTHRFYVQFDDGQDGADYVTTTVGTDPVTVQPLKSDLEVTTTADAAHATADGIPTTVTTVLEVDPSDTLQRDVSLAPAPASSCTRSETTDADWRTITVVCHYVRAPGTSPSFTATYTDALVGALTATAPAYRIPDSPVTVTATADDVTYGTGSTVSASVQPVVTGAKVSGSVSVADGGTVVCTFAVLPSSPTGSCVTSPLPHAGDHQLVATYLPDGSGATATGASDPAGFHVARAAASIALGRPSVSTAGGTSSLGVTATATTDGGGPVPTGSVTFGGAMADCGTVALVSGAARCSIALPAAGSRVTLSASYTPGPDFVAGASTSDSTTFQRTPSGTCTGGFAAFWSLLAAHHGAVDVDAGPLGSVALAGPSSMGDCDTAAALGLTGSVSLFQGTLRATSLTATLTSQQVCLDPGSTLSMPAVWRTGALSVTDAVCFPYTSAGGLGTPTSGALALGNSGGSGPPLLSLPGVTAPASLTAVLGQACAGGVVGDTSCTTPTPALTVTGTVARTSDTVPGVTVTATVRSDGSIGGTVAVTPLTLLGTSVTLAGTVSRTGTGSLSASVSATTASAASPATGLVLDSGASVSLTGGTGSSPTLSVDGTVRVAAGTSAELAVGVHGQISSAGDYTLQLATVDPAPTWTPTAGLTLSPELSGSLVHKGASTTFALSATGSGGAPLATWQAPGGVTVTVGGVSLGGDPTAVDLKCPYTDRGSVLALSGSVSVGGLSVAASGCLTLGGGSGTGWHLAATGTTTTLGRLSVSSLVLDVNHPAAGSTILVGSAQARLQVGSFDQTATITLSLRSGTLVVGGRIDASSLGLGPAYVAYASAPATGWQTGIDSVGDGGSVDLPAGISLFGSLQLPAGVASALRQAKFSLSANATVTFEALVPTSGGSLSFTAQLGDPNGMPLLTLPGGGTVSAATLTYADRTFTLVADGSVTGQDGSQAPVHLSVTIAATGAVTGTASVTGLSLFGRTVTLTGSVTRTAAGALTVSVTGSLTGSISVADATLHDVTITLGTAGLSASGSLDVASTTVTFAVAFASTSSYTLTVSTTVRGWTPAPGVTVNAALTGSVTRSTKGWTYDLTAAPLAPATGLVTLTPATGVTLALTSFEVGNGATPPSGCTLGATGDTWLAVSGSLTLALGAASGTGTGAGCFDLTKPGFSLTVSVPGASFGDGGKVSLTGLAVNVSRSGASGFAADARARLNVQMPSGGQFSLLAVLTFGPDGFAIGGVADLSSYLGGSAATAYLFYSNASMTVATGDPTVGSLKLQPGVTVGLAFTVSDSVAKALHTVGLSIGSGSKLAATVRLDLSAATITMKVALSFQQTYLFTESDGTFLRLDDLALAMTLSPTQPSFAFQTSGTLHVPSTVPGGTASDVTLSGGIRIGTELSAYLSVSNWHDALGLNGLDLTQFTLQGGITLTGLPLPSLAVSATVTGLPSTLASVIGYQQGAPISLALAIGETNLLVDLSIGTKDSSTVALSPFHFVGRDDLLAVHYAELYLSPTGATIGDTVYPAGFSLAFQGVILGVDVDVDLQINPVAMSLHFKGTVGTISVGSLVMGPTTLSIDVSPSRFDVAFSGRIKAGPATTQIGPALRLGGSLDADVTLAVGTSGISAHLNAAVSVWSSAYVPTDWCFEYAIWIPCDYEWQDTTPLSFSLTNLGFSVDSSGLTVDVPNTSSSITVPWPSSPLSASERRLGGGAGEHGVQALDVAAAGGLAPVRAVHVTAPAVPVRAGSWTPTGQLGAGQAAPSTVTLRDGSVLVLGGARGGHALADASIYDPTTGGWREVAPMTTARIAPSVVRLADGRVLVAGGGSAHGAVSSAEIFDPRSGHWSAAGALSVGREAASAVLLGDGSVLVAGGHVGGDAVTTVDRFDPRTGRWTASAPLPSPRAAAAAATVGGRVLLAGGMGAHGPLRTAVEWDPASGAWHAVAPMADPRFYATATTLDDGSVLVAGGTAAAERFDPRTGRWTNAGLLSGPALLASAVRLTDGDVLVIGGLGGHGALTQVDRYHPATNRWTAQASLPAARGGAAAAVLPSGDVLVAGGLSGSRSLSDAYVYAARSGQVRGAAFTPLGSGAGGGMGVAAWFGVAGGVTLLLGLIVLVGLRRRRTG